MPPMTVSDHNTNMSKHLYQPVMPLSEANLCKHTIHMTPVSRQAKLNNLLGYVDRQRELVSSEDDAEQPAKQLRSPYRLRRHSYRESYVPDGLDPALALPRALPKRTMPRHHDADAVRDSSYSGVGIEYEYQNIDNINSEIPTSPNGCAPAHDIVPHEDWTQRPSRRPLQFKRYNAADDFEVQRRPLVRRPTTASLERVKKLGRGFAFLSKGRRPNLRRHGSLNAPTTRSEESDSAESKDQNRFRSLTYRTGRALGAGVYGTSSSETQSEELIKPRGTVKQMFMDVFKRSNKSETLTVTSDYDPTFPEPSFLTKETQLYTWPKAIEPEEDFQGSSGSDQSPFTARDPWSPEPAISSAKRDSASFNLLFNVEFRKDDAPENDGDDDNESETTLKSAHKMPIAALINSLAAFGLDYVSHNPYSTQRLMEQEQAANMESAGFRHNYNNVVAAM